MQHLTGSLPLCIPSVCAIMCKQLCKSTGLFLPSEKRRELYRQGVKLEVSLSVRKLPSVLQQKKNYFIQKLWVLSDTKRKSCFYHIPVLSTTRPALSKKLLQLSKIISLQNHCYPSNSLQKQSVFQTTLSAANCCDTDISRCSGQCLLLTTTASLLSLRNYWCLHSCPVRRAFGQCNNLNHPALPARYETVL